MIARPSHCLARLLGWMALGLAALLLGVLDVAPAAAQQNQPIYPAYDGFWKNPDGSYTVAFAYFSHNAETVTVPAGTANAFAPAPGDRQQPTVFKPGHWRFQCVMVVGPEFDGKMVWTLSYAGTTTGTSQHMLQSNWYLVEGAEEVKKIDYAKVKRGVCLNRAPVVRVLGTVGRGENAKLAPVASVGEQYSLFGSVNDEGLPRGRTIVTGWKQVSGPGTAKFQDAAVARTHVSFPAPGEYVLELTASDSELSSSARVEVTVK